MEFYERRGAILERLFACRRLRCSECNRVSLHVLAEEEEEEEEVKEEVTAGEAGGGGLSKVGSSMTGGKFSVCQGEAGEERRVAEEVMRIMKVLDIMDNESHSTPIKLLQRLQSMPITLEILNDTKIGFVVNFLRKHNSEQIRQIARTIVGQWKSLVDEWVRTTTCSTEATPQSLNRSCSNLERLPCPPVAMQTNKGKLSQSNNNVNVNSKATRETINQSCSNLDGLSCPPVTVQTTKRKLSQSSNVNVNDNGRNKHQTLLMELKNLCKHGNIPFVPRKPRNQRS